MDGGLAGIDAPAVAGRAVGLVFFVEDVVDACSYGDVGTVQWEGVVEMQVADKIRVEGVCFVVCVCHILFPYPQTL